MKTSYELDINIDRYDSDYLMLLSHLLSKECLIENAQPLKFSDKLYGMYKKKIVIKFCGLSGLSIIGGAENLGTERLKVVRAFINLITNKDDIIKELNEEYQTYVDVKLLFVYPYSDFMYDLIQAEITRLEGTSITCQKDQKEYIYDFRTTQRLTYKDLSNSRSVQHLYNSLDKIQEAVNASKDYINSPQKPNRVIVKFCPINISTCFLKINHTIFVDPYVFSKQDVHEKQLSLITPISRISIPPVLDINENLPEREGKIHEHYRSLVNHFRYLWYNPLTLYSTDATEYAKGENDTLRKIKEPKSISYLAKAEHLASIQGKKYPKSEIDLWKQHCKNEFLRHCSKFLKSTKDYQIGPQAPGKININPISIFIVGAWRNGSPNDYMSLVEKFIISKFDPINIYGIKLKPIVINAENGTDFRRLIFEGLNSSQLAIVIQTNDYSEPSVNFSRPNVYIEKGYLMGRLGKKFSRSSEKENHEPVFVFIEEGTNDGSDTNNIAQTRFSNLEYFELQFFKIVKWLWEITELNSNYTIEILNEYVVRFEDDVLKEKDANRKQILGDLLNLVRQFKSQIITWESEYGERMRKLSN